MTFDHARYLRLRKAYNAAVAEGAETFEFDGAEFYTPYAFYLLEYLRGVLRTKEEAFE
jgi:hypothetical protein